MIKNIIFDIGDVLVEFRWREFLQQKGFSQEMTERIANASVRSDIWIELDRGVWDYEHILQGFIKKDPGIAKEIRNAYGDMKDIVVMQSYTMEWLDGLKEQGKKLYYLSNWSERLETDCAKALTFRACMDGGILSWKERLVKPSAEIYRLLLDRYQLLPEESVFIDDREANVRAAEGQGMHGICFQSYEQAKQELEALLKRQEEEQS